MSLNVEDLSREIGTAVSRAYFCQKAPAAAEIRLTEGELTVILTEACALAVSIALGEPPPKLCDSLLQTSGAEARVD